MKPFLTITLAGTLAVTLTDDMAQAIETIEAVGAGKMAFEVEFLAPDNAFWRVTRKRAPNSSRVAPP